MKYQLLSDLHLEFTPFILQKADDADALILAGDIGNPASIEYQTLIKDVSELYKYVFLIKGNHEVYGSDLKTTDERIQQILDLYTNVFYLNNMTIDIENTNIRVLGTTLFTEIMDDQRSDISIFLADFRMIGNWSIETNNAQHFKDVRFIKDEVKRAKEDNKELLIITHHAPSTYGTVREEHKGSPLSSAFCTDLNHLFTPPIKTWICGHTHHSFSLMINNIPLISNQRGYGNEKTQFNPIFTFDM
jgi:predicted phosphodiesterase